MNRQIEKLNKDREKNQKIHCCNVDESDYDRIKPIIQFLDKLSTIESSIYAVYDMNKHNYILKSREQKRLFGFSTDDDIQTHYSNIHPDDLAFVLEADNMVYDFYSNIVPDEKMDYKLVYDFRIKNVDGIFMRYMHQAVTLELDNSGKVWLSLVISHQISESSIYEKPQRRLINMKTKKLHLFEDEELKSNYLLSNRETEILDLIARGYESRDIAEKLFISINTVNNHRQNILRKTQTENTNQAILYCKRLGVL
jgi:DNA-binding CsgD family transcriptional regulator